ncbi:ABC-F type ribosomal protection protein [Pullulanibacillus sp. KACC 23026]|uniref:ribosomal protection-like ABC-F family protein n=1 Tax=Pullulanibacillus sp. KACC 23026 TaxID=3028315 RepID=UPI0023B02138|nr:ABC-F type ribosomal protection protein [Pullulanibacillus sp. KACC 23026]WEG12171.1 ABC-F type ribosomal protection protein [Pullulanibacillus sp. KACC 23026]
MPVLKAEMIHVEINGRDILKNGSIELEKGEHVALIGQNGKGKTTFLKAILGQIPISGGKLMSKFAESDWAWMAQSPEAADSETVREFVERERPVLNRLKQQMNCLSKEAEHDPAFTEAYMKVLQEFMDLDGYEWETQVERSLMQMGIAEDKWDQPFSELSGGQKTKVQLARMQLKEASFLIFDEPTNHLDVETIHWLAEWINHYKGTVLLVSHDRAFIDKVAHTTYELTDSGIRKYKGGYKDYLAQKELERESLEAAYKKQEQERKSLVEAISTYKTWFNKAHNAASERDPHAKKRANKNMTRFKAKEAALERLEKHRVKKPQEEEGINVSFDAQAFSSPSMLHFDHVDFGYGGRRVFKDISFFIEKGDRLGVLGQNGAGKTTLLNLIIGDIEPDQGVIYRHPELKIGYFKQELDQLPEESTILDYILTLPGLTQSEARTILACFLFPKEDVFKPIKSLSMGEKCRVAFVRLYLSEANLLVLDEPTNYLDIATREKIEEALTLYPGAVVLVSHDHYLLQKVITRVISLYDGFHYFPGTYAEWQSVKEERGYDQEKRRQLSTLQLQYTQLVSEEVEQEEEQRGLLERIKEIRQQIARLEQELDISN